MFIILISLPFLATLLLPFLGKALSKSLGFVACLAPLGSLVGVFLLWKNFSPEHAYVLSWPWIENLSVSFSFLIDGLSLFWGFVVTGMGLLVTLYAAFYLDNSIKHRGRFYAYLMFFMGAMLGTVFANNLLLLFLFWELTGIASFFLIGFFHHKDESRLGARMALITTGATGLLMLIGVVVVHTWAGTLELDQIFQTNLDALFKHGVYNVAVVVFLLAAFGKSAQFPFHYWLPRAMAAPTPVSAYLHSAAMVKLGIFLCARLYPILVHSDIFQPALIAIGFFTMMIGAIFAVLSHDLKAILAYSTISQLGFLLGHFGLAQIVGARDSYFHILNHVFYKGTLFMVVGIVDHSLHCRDIRKLGSLFKAMPLTAMACLFAVLAMAGVPGTTGFISKELMLDRIYNLALDDSYWYFLVLLAVIVAAVCLVIFSIRIFYHTFIRRSAFVESAKMHNPGLGIQLSPFVLSLCVLVFGFFPNALAHLLESFSVSRLTLPTHHLALWHGFSGPFLTSVLIFTLGAILYKVCNRKKFNLGGIPQILQFDFWFNKGYQGYMDFCDRLQTFLKAKSQQDYLAITLGALSLILLWFALPVWNAISWNISFAGDIETLLAGVVFVLIAFGIVGCLYLKRWMAKVLALSFIGFLVTFYFVLYRAPDLALTQILVETASLLILMFLFYRFGLQDEQNELQNPYPKKRKIFSLVVALTLGFSLFVILYAVVESPAQTNLRDYFLEQTLPLAGGSNTVNTILVDFRGYDTMGEISVLVLALLGSLGLLTRRRKKGSVTHEN